MYLCDGEGCENSGVTVPRAGHILAPDSENKIELSWTKLNYAIS